MCLIYNNNRTYGSVVNKDVGVKIVKAPVRERNGEWH